VADLAPHVEKTQKGPQACGQQSNILAGSVLRTLEQKSTQDTGVEPTERSDAMLLLQEMKQLGN
jgi:hypothetical protein